MKRTTERLMLVTNDLFQLFITINNENSAVIYLIVVCQFLSTIDFCFSDMQPSRAKSFDSCLFCLLFFSLSPTLSARGQTRAQKYKAQKCSFLPCSAVVCVFSLFSPISLSEFSFSWHRQSLYSRILSGIKISSGFGLSSKEVSKGL